MGCGGGGGVDRKRDKKERKAARQTGKQQCVRNPPPLVCLFVCVTAL